MPYLCSSATEKSRGDEEGALLGLILQSNAPEFENARHGHLAARAFEGRKYWQRNS